MAVGAVVGRSAGPRLADDRKTPPVVTRGVLIVGALVVAGCSGDGPTGVPDRPLTSYRTTTTADATLGVNTDCAVLVERLADEHAHLMELASAMDMGGHPDAAQALEDAASMLGVDVCAQPGS